MAPHINDILRLSLAERILWAEALWASIALEDSPGSYGLTDGQMALLNEEMEAYRADPNGGLDWEEAKKQIRKG